MADAVSQSLRGDSLRTVLPSRSGDWGDAALAPPRIAFWMLVVYLVLEYVRPPVVVHLKLQMIVTLAIPVMWLVAQHRTWHRVMGAELLFLGLCIKNLPIAWNYYSVYFTTRNMYGHLATALGLMWVGSRYRNLQAIVWLWLGMMGYQALVAIRTGGRGSGGMLGDENDVALALGTAFPIAIAGFEHLSGWRRWVALAVSILLVVGIVASASRGGLVGLAAAVIYMVAISRHRFRATLALLAVGAVMYVNVSDEYRADMETISDTDEGTAKHRFFMWEAGYNMWLDHKWLGVGAGNVRFLIGEYQPKDYEGADYNTRNWSGTTVHSMYFQILPELGIPGVLLVLYLTVNHFMTLRRINRDLKKSTSIPDDVSADIAAMSAGFGGAMVGFLTAGAFLSVAYYPYFWYLAAMGAALELAARRELDGPPHEAPVSDSEEGSAAAAPA